MKIILLIGLILIGVVVGIYFDSLQEDKLVIMEKNKFLGPVPEGYDEEYFRKTGITKLLEDKR